MNAQGRKQLAAVLGKIEALKASAEELAGEVRDLADAEQEKFDNMPEGLQQGEKGEALEQGAGSLGEVADALEEGSLQDALDALGQVVEA